ncbi:uncharacterized protein LOC117582997 [Drosophila guanche]|uniref:Peptidase S1 domain-containing protein n=1 Tax=Drosophila guanche TaxID=7266 RepID=A0A3B0JEM9_DROGU|nr:uncharacterized protein LOC117582997 [Drosophila guanche]SPP80787.1 Hypothetical predicted protein [Drosophila guanche]
MLRSKLLLLANALIVVCLGHVQSSKGHEFRKHKLKYIKDDWQPHFGYNNGHYAYEHQHRYKARSTTVKGRIHGQTLLDDYVVRIMVDGKLICNGIIVDTQQVLTVSTCLIDAPLDKMLVKLLDGSRYKVTSSSSARGYATEEGEKLLTLIKLGTELDGQYKKPPPMCRNRIRSSEPVQMWTWNNRKTYLKKNQVSQVLDAKCKRQVNDLSGLVIKNYTSCVVNTQTSKGCQRNFGLPYVHDHSFCGMNILGHNCPKASNADVYVRLLDEKRYISERLNMVRRSGIDNEIF